MEFFQIAGIDRDFVYLCMGNYQGYKKIHPIVRYAVSSFKKHQRDMAYQIYIADGVFAITNSKMMKDSFNDWWNRSNAKESSKSADEIAADIINKIKGE